MQAKAAGEKFSIMDRWPHLRGCERLMSKLITNHTTVERWLRLSGHTYHVIAKNCIIQKMIARPFLCHCKIKQKMVTLIVEM